MIDAKTKIHDNLTLEFKVGFIARRKQKTNNFKMAMWIFIPKSLALNRTSYPKKSFYEDMKSNIRLMTPRFLLRDIVGGEAKPYLIVKNACSNFASTPTNTNKQAFEYHLKMFAAIIKSSVREETNYILKTNRKADADQLCHSYNVNIREILDKFHALRTIISAPLVPDEQMSSYKYADEFICNTLIVHIYKILARRDCQELTDLAKDINAYRQEMDYSYVKLGEDESNSAYIHRYGLLKKFVESQLFLRAPKKKDGALVEQAYFSLAAGLAMLFATGVAWAFQSTFGNLTWPLFIALVISYMMKDRIKELMRFYFVHRMSNRYFDNTAKMIHNGVTIGTFKEAMDFVNMDNVPKEILNLRYNDHVIAGAESRLRDEDVILYRKQVVLDRDKLESDSAYVLPGVNDIMRLHLHRFIHNMDDPQVQVNCIDADDKIVKTSCAKVYHLNLLVKYEYDDVVDYKRFRVTMNRDGIQSIIELI